MEGELYSKVYSLCTYSVSTARGWFVSDLYDLFIGKRTHEEPQQSAESSSPKRIRLEEGE